MNVALDVCRLGMWLSIAEAGICLVLCARVSRPDERTALGVISVAFSLLALTIYAAGSLCSS